jgi:predicted adenine nucleotide alpha hydrolase (AANH) superfamily ATPase
MTALLLHACCGPCSTVAVPAWRECGVEPVGWFENPNVQPDSELVRRLDSMRRYSRAAGLELIVPVGGEQDPAWRAWREDLHGISSDARCAGCLQLRLGAAGAAARDLGFERFSTTLTVSPYQRHDLIREAGEAAADLYGVDFVYLDVRARYRHSYAESRRLDLYRQPYCGCAASKWDAWHARRARRRGRTA